MKRLTLNTVTPQKKIVSTNNRFGNKNIKKQQGSSVIIYDTLPLDGETYFEFFRSAKNRSFPDTNLTQGTLQPGESFALERAYFTVVTKDPLSNDAISGLRAPSLTTDAPIVGGEFHFTIENSRVIKPMPVTSWLGVFNKSADIDDDSVFEFDTQIVMPPLLELAAILRTDEYDPADYPDQYLRLVLEGAGSIFAPKQNY